MSDTTTTTVAAIRAAAEARSLLGQAATHELLPDGRHRVAIYDRTAGKLLIGVGASVAQAVENLTRERGGPQT
jgi:hypothetical protein